MLVREIPPMRHEWKPAEPGIFWIAIAAFSGVALMVVIGLAVSAWLIGLA